MARLGGARLTWLAAALGAVVPAACSLLTPLDDLSSGDGDGDGGQGGGGADASAGGMGGGGAGGTGVAGGASTGGAGATDGGPTDCADAGLTPCGASCVDPTSDDKHCGRCDHDCLGGACIAGACQPVALATGQAYPLDLAIDSTNAYWTIWGTLPSNYNDGEIRKCALTGCANAPTTVAKSSDEPTSIAIDATNVYFGNHGTGRVAKCPLTGCAVMTQLSSSAGDPRGIAVDATNVYWVEFDAGTVKKCAIGGCGLAPTTIGTGLAAPWGIAIDASSAYTGGDSIVKVPLSGGGGVAILASGQFARGVAVDATNVATASVTCLDSERIRSLGA